MARQFTDKELKQAKKQAKDFINSLENTLKEAESLTRHDAIKGSIERNKISEQYEQDIRMMINSINMNIINEIERDL